MNALSGILFLMGFLPYIYSILKGKTHPSPISWTIWASVDTLVIIAMIKEKAKVGQLTGAVFGAWTVAILAVLYGKAGMGYIEWISVVGGFAGIITWKKTGNPVTAIICSQAALLIGAIPTITNAWINPAQENLIAWSIWTMSCICALFAIKKWDLANALQPLTFMVIEGTVMVLVVIRPWLT